MTIEIIIAIVLYATMFIFLYVQRKDPVSWRFLGKYVFYALMVMVFLAIIGTIIPGFGFTFRSLLNPYLYIYLLPFVIISSTRDYRKEREKLKASAEEKE